MKKKITGMRRQARSRGFTLIELVIVLIVLAILSSTVILRTSATTARGVTTNADQLRQDIAHMQMLAMTWGVPLRLTVAADGASYTVTCRSIGTSCTSLSTPPTDPATGARFKTTLTDGVVVSPANATLNFDSMGRPVNGAVLISANPAASLSVTGGGQSMTVSVYPITGFAVAN